MKIAVRMDDISPRMDWTKWRRADRILREHHIMPLLGVVPDNRDPNLDRDDNTVSEEEFWQFLRERRKEGYVLALHGRCHVYDGQKGGMFPLNSFSEFAGLPYEVQYERLELGRKILEEHQIQAELFMAPAHAYDRNTLRALKELGICRVTDGFGSRPYCYRGITFYPIAYHLEKQMGKPGYTTYVLHTNTMEEKDFERLEKIVSEQDAISYRDYLEVTPKRAGLVHRFTEFWMALAKRVLVQWKARKA